MIETTISATIFIAYFLLLLAFAYVTRSVSQTEYRIAGRSVGAFGVAAALTAAVRDGAGISVWISLSVAFGFGSSWLLVGLFAGLLTVAAAAGRVNARARECGWNTPYDWIHAVVGPVSAQLVSLVILVTATLYAGAQVYVAGGILSAYTGWNSLISLLLVVGTVGLYTIVGGYAAVTQTDKLQWGLICLVVAVPLFMGPDLIYPSLSSFLSPGLALGTGLATISFLFIVSSGDTWQRVFSARSPVAARNGVLFTIPIYLIISLGLVVFSVNLFQVIPTNVEGDIIFQIASESSLDQIFVSLFGLVVIASLMSTLDTQTFLFASTAEKYLPSSFLSKGNSAIIYLAIAFLVVLGAVSFAVGDIVQFVFSAVTLGTVLVPVFVTCAFASNIHASDLEVGVSIAIGVCCYIFLYCYTSFENVIYTALPAIVASVALLIAIGRRRFARA